MKQCDQFIKVLIYDAKVFCFYSVIMENFEQNSG